MGTITLSLATWWEIIISFGTIIVGVLYIGFAITVRMMQLKKKLGDSPEEKQLAKHENPPNIIQAQTYNNSN